MMRKAAKEAHNGAATKLAVASARHLGDGAVTPGYHADPGKVVALLNAALATELVCYLRYMRHYYTASGAKNLMVKAEFLQHAQEELGHANQIAERIMQLNGKPEFNPAQLVDHSHADYDDSSDVQDMIKADLKAERIAIDEYRTMISQIDHSDLTTRHLLISILAKEEEHAEDMRDLMS